MHTFPSILQNDLLKMLYASKLKVIRHTSLKIL
jgi:hypothetical protein